MSCASVRSEAVNGTPTGAFRNHLELGVRTYTTAWCTYCLLDGRISDICTQRSSVKPVGTIVYEYSMSPVAGLKTDFGICTTRSGLGMFQPSAQRGGGGASCLSPAGVLASTHAAIVRSSCGVS